MLLLSQAEVERLLDLDELRAALVPAMIDVSEGRASIPDRTGALVAEHDGILVLSGGFLPSSKTLAAKLVTHFPGNGTAGLPTHQGLIAVFDADNGRPVAVLDGAVITALRTASGSALSADLLARDDAHVLAILGTGLQARLHARAVARTRSFDAIRIAGRTPERAEALAAELDAELPVPVSAVDGFEAACAGADVVCATTHPVEPVVRREWLAPGTHVTSVGYNRHGREVDDATVAEALLVVESRRAALAPIPAGSNDLLEPIARGVIGPEHVHAEIGELLSGAKPGRTSPEQLTLYKSVGIAAQDCAAAALVVTLARERAVGREIEL